MVARSFDDYSKTETLFSGNRIFCLLLRLIYYYWLGNGREVAYDYVSRIFEVK